MARAPQFDRSGLSAGMRLAVAVSAGADSVGLLRALAEAAPEIGLVLSVAHVHHGIRGAAADEDAAFVAKLAQKMDLVPHVHRVDTPETARERGQSLEEAGRELRYAWFRLLMEEGRVHAVATAHTLDDQAETVLHRLLRGAWTEGLGGIHPVVACPRGAILRPFLATRRAEIVDWLRSIGQSWREDASNQDVTFTRNRIRHQLLPQMAGFNLRITEQLAHLAAIARDEEDWWETELRRMLPSLLLPVRPVRGGGRAVPTHPNAGSAGMELERLRALAPALRRRVLRAAAAELGCRLSFEETQRLMALCGPGAARREQLASRLRAVRSARELRLVREPESEPGARDEAIEAPIPGDVSGLGVKLRLRLTESGASGSAPPSATLRGPRPGDRVTLLHTRGAKPLKEIFERLKIEPEARKSWPLLEWEGRIVWMQDVPVAAEPPVPFRVEVLGNSAGS
ncbi:MAG: tRNA lysidine(34) synthetase TilS [Acidobacteriaceae bacterium]